MTREQVTNLISAGRLKEADRVSKGGGPWNAVTDYFPLAGTMPIERVSSISQGSPPQTVETPPPPPDEGPPPPDETPPPLPDDEPTPDTSEVTEWHYRKEGETLGPVTADKLRRLLDDGTIGESTMVWKKGLTDWVKLSESGLTKETLRTRPATEGRAIAASLSTTAKTVDWIAYAPALYAIALGIAIIAVLCPWYTVSDTIPGMGSNNGISPSLRGFATVPGILVFLAAVAGELTNFLKIRQVQERLNWILAGLGGGVALFALLGLLSPSSVKVGDFGDYEGYAVGNPTFGVWLAILAGCVAIVVGFFRTPMSRIGNGISGAGSGTSSTGEKSPDSAVISSGGSYDTVHIGLSKLVSFGSHMLRKLGSADSFAWIKDLPLLFVKPGSFFERRAAERTLYPALLFCIGYTFLISLIPLLVVAARVGAEYVPFRMLIYIPLAWVAAISIRGLLLGLVVTIKKGSPIARSFKQGFTVDAFSWVSFFTYWMFATLWLFCDAQPPTSVGPYVFVGFLGLLCRLHGYFLDLRGLSTVSDINWAVAGILVLVIDAISSFIILIMMSLILYHLFS